MRSNMEKAAHWAGLAEQQRDPIERQADAAVAQVYATMVVADRLTRLTVVTAEAGGIGHIDTPRMQWWGDGS